MKRSLAVLLSLTSLSVLAEPSAGTLRQLGATVREAGGAIVELGADTKGFSETEYRLVGQCTRLKKLSLNGPTLTDTTLPLLAGLASLEELSLNQSQLSDDGYRHFAALTNLQTLALWHPSWAAKNFTGSGLAHLRALPNLRKLTFAGATAGDEALAAIGQITRLREFSTWHTAQTQAGNAHLLALTNLTSFRIGQRLPPWGKALPPSFDDETLAVIARMSSLESLELFEARLTGKALGQLKALPRLARLKIHTAEVSDADIAALRTALPGVQLDFKPITAEDREATLVKKLKLQLP